MSEASQTQLYSADDPVSNVLKWILLAVAIVCFALIAWATMVTYDRAPPQPDRFAAPDGTTVMTAERYRRRQGRISEGRPDGLRKPVWNGLLFR